MPFCLILSDFLSLLHFLVLHPKCTDCQLFRNPNLPSDRCDSSWSFLDIFINWTCGKWFFCRILSLKSIHFGLFCNSCLYSLPSVLIRFINTCRKSLSFDGTFMLSIQWVICCLFARLPSSLLGWNSWLLTWEVASEK